MPENTPTAKDARSARRWCCCVLLAILWCASLPLACLPGPVPVAVADVWQALGAVVGLCPPADGSVQLVVGQIRLARVLLGLLCGGALAVAGVALQGVLRNPLADPFTLGISAGAACGASMAIALGGSLGIWAGGLAVGLSAAATVSLAALLGSLLALGGALWLGSGQGSFRRETVILAGIAVAAFLGAVVALVKALNEESVTSIVFWIMGSLQGRGWDSVPLLLATLLPGLLVVLPGWRKLDMLALGDEQAAHLGLAVGRTRFWLLAGASCMTAGCVAVAGVIGFVGLVVPHVLRMLLGSAHGPLLYGAFLGGGILLVWADVLARCVLSGGQPDADGGHGAGTRRGHPPSFPPGAGPPGGRTFPAQCRTAGHDRPADGPAGPLSLAGLVGQLQRRRPAHRPRGPGGDRCLAAGRAAGERAFRR